jgi:N-ethylmaleimide reductase
VEGTQPSYAAQGYARTPGIHTDEQVAAWKKVTDAVHAKGAKIFVQLMHAGRIAHPDNRLVKDTPVAPSAVKPAVQMYTDTKGMQDIGVPHALTLEEIPKVIEEFAHATRCALKAGFDGVQLHGASGYLVHQFLSSNANLRTDAYGGSFAGRSRFALETLEAMISAAGSSQKVAIKISPVMGFNDVVEDDPAGLYTYLAHELSGLNLAFVDVLRSRKFDALKTVRDAYKGTLLAGGGYTAGTAEAALLNKEADLVAFGSSFLANPDLPRRFELGAELNQPDVNTFYTPGPKGYTDYPFLKQ